MPCEGSRREGATLAALSRNISPRPSRRMRQVLTTARQSPPMADINPCTGARLSTVACRGGWRITAESIGRPWCHDACGLAATIQTWKQQPNRRDGEAYRTPWEGRQAQSIILNSMRAGERVGQRQWPVSGSSNGSVDGVKGLGSGAFCLVWQEV